VVRDRDGRPLPSPGLFLITDFITNGPIPGLMPLLGVGMGCHLASGRTSAGTSCQCISTRNSVSRSETARSLRIIAAIDGDRAAGHPARLVGGEKQYGADKVLRLAEAAERDLSNRRALPLGVGVAGAG
jgi:hypothetical protein